MLGFVGLVDEALSMEQQPFDRVIAALMRQNGVSREDAASQVHDFLGKVDSWMEEGVNVLDLFITRFQLHEDYLLDLLFS
jgi:hypothetical protein